MNKDLVPKIISSAAGGVAISSFFAISPSIPIIGATIGGIIAFIVSIFNNK